MLTIKYHTSFKRELKNMKKRGCNTELLKEAVDILIAEKPLPEKYRDHGLHGKYAGFRECHIQPDWLLIYKVERDELTLSRTGTHSDLFNK